MQVSGEPLAATALHSSSPIPTCALATAIERADGYHVERVPHACQVVLLELQPVTAAPAGLIGITQRLHNQPLCGGVNSLIQEGLKQVMA